MTETQRNKAARFRALHEGPGAFVIPNPWDAGSARVLAAMGFAALATSSGACAGVLGRRDGNVSREEALMHARNIVSATGLPVAADLERGFGDAPDVVADTIRLAGEAGLVGGSIEDATGNAEKPLYDVALAVERVAAAAEAARALPFPFTLTARAENFLRGKPDLDDTIRRLQAYEKAGADVLFAPGLPDLASVRRVCAALSKPVNFMVGIKGKSFTVAELKAAGVKRISLATSLYRAAMSGLLNAAQEIRKTGTFDYLDRSLAFMVEKGDNRILVAGASGAIGRRLCRLLVEEGWHVTGTTRSADKAAALRAIGVAPVVVDVFDEEKLRGVVAEAGPATIVHQLTDLPPGLDPAKMAEARIRNARIREIGTRNLVAAAVASGVKRMVAQSIAFAYAPGAMPYREDSPLNVDHPDIALTARAVASLEHQVLNGPFEGVVLRYGRLYGAGTGFDNPPHGGPVHVDAAADAARRALTRGRGVYNIAEEDGTVSSRKAADELGWDASFRID